MTSAGRAREQAARILALDVYQRLYALMWLRFTDPDALDRILGEAEAWESLRT